jgi:competence protein ComEC
MVLVWAGSAWLFGLILAILLPLNLWQWLSLALGGLIAAIIFHKDLKFRTIFLSLFFIFFAASRWESSTPKIDQEHVAYYADTALDVLLIGWVNTDPDVRDNQTRLEITVEHLSIPALEIEKPVRGSILVTTSPLRTYRYGERVRLRGSLELPPEEGDFSYREYLSRQGIYAWMPDAHIRSMGLGPVNPILDRLSRWRGKAFDEIQRLFPYPEAPLIAGILLGIESYIPDHLSRAYSATGTTHIIAISGFNITIMAGLAIAVFGRWFGRTRGLLLAGILILLYTIFVGGDAPVVRAAIMGVLALMARFLGRRTHGLTSLVAAATIMTGLDPQVLLDVGFQLSFLATLGLILYAEPLGKIATAALQHYFPRLDSKRWGNLVAEMVFFTLAAQITTLPIIAWHFHQISVISIIANALILPLQPFLMILSGIATIVGLIWQPLGSLIARFAWPFSAMTNRLVTLFATIPGGVLYTGTIHPGWIAMYYFGLFGLTALMHSSWWPKLRDLFENLFSQRRSIAVSVYLMMMSLASLLIWHSIDHKADGQLHVTILNVGRGEAVLIQTPSGGTLLANGGSSPLRLATALGQYLPYPDRKIDWLLLGGSQYKQIAGLRDIASMTTIDQVLISGTAESSAYSNLLESFHTAAIPVRLAQSGNRLDLGDGATLEVLHIGSKGMTFLLTYGHSRLFFPLGLSPADIPEIVRNQASANITVGLLADEGYEAVNPASLLEHLNPRILVVSCATNTCPLGAVPPLRNDISHFPILQTDRYGSIELITDGNQLWITTEFNPETGIDELPYLARPPT